MPRCAAYQYPSIVLGASDLALYGRTLPWDHAAGTIFINEAGGRAARLDGSPYLAHDRQPNLIAACSLRLWDEFAILLCELNEYAG
jgi:fructose-1,6-bisphosphatase/inositol monophosphatase family enzyme